MMPSASLGAHICIRSVYELVNRKKPYMSSTGVCHMCTTIPPVEACSYSTLIGLLRAANSLLCFTLRVQSIAFGPDLDRAATGLNCHVTIIGQLVDLLWTKNDMCAVGRPRQSKNCPIVLPTLSPHCHLSQSIMCPTTQIICIV